MAASVFAFGAAHDLRKLFLGQLVAFFIKGFNFFFKFVQFFFGFHYR